MRRLIVALGLAITSSSLTGYPGQSGAAKTDGVVYIASNAAGGNEILVFDRNERGSLSFAHAVATGGLGSGTLVLRDLDGVAARTGAGSAPADAALSAGGQFLYTRNGGNGTISAFSVNDDGTLTSLSTFGGLPGGANGIAAR